MSDPTYLTCPVDGGAWFTPLRRLFTLTLDDGTKQRNWASGENTSTEVLCGDCGSRLRWNAETQSYVVTHHGPDILPPTV